MTGLRDIRRNFSQVFGDCGEGESELLFAALCLRHGLVAVRRDLFVRRLCSLEVMEFGFSTCDAEYSKDPSDVGHKHDAVDHHVSRAISVPSHVFSLPPEAGLGSSRG